MDWGWLGFLAVIAAIMLALGLLLRHDNKDDDLGIALAFAGGVILFVCAFVFGSAAAFARDRDGRFAESPLKSWFDGLRSGNGPCCSDADGTAVSDPDWRRVNDPAKADVHFQVYLKGEWVDVYDRAVVKEPNKAHVTMVWPVFNGASMYGGVGPSTFIRCFMPGDMAQNVGHTRRAAL